MSRLQELLNSTKTDNDALNSIDTGGSATKDPLDPLNWRPKAGEQLVRILPALDGKPLKEVSVHWKVAKQPFLCPKKNFGEHCPVCDFGWDQWGEAGDSKALKEKAKVFLPDQRYAALVVVRDLEEIDINGVEGKREAHGKPFARIWDFNWSTYKDLRKIMKNEEYGNIESVVDGFDMTLTWDPDLAAAREQSTTVLPRRKETLALNFKDKKGPYAKILKNEEDMAGMIFEMLEEAPDIYGRFPRVTSEEALEFLQRYEEKPSANSDNVEKYGKGAEDGVATDAASKINKFFKDNEDE